MSALRAVVERGERLVEQQQARPHQQRAADRDALAFAARQLAGPALEQMADVEQLDHMRERRRIGRVAAHPAAVVEIVLHAEMRKQPAFLEHIADAAAPGRHVDARRVVEQHLVVEHDAAAVRPQQAGDHVDDARLAGARRAEQDGGAAFAGELRRHREIAELFFDVDRQHRSGPVQSRAGAAGEPFRRDQARRAR